MHTRLTVFMVRGLNMIILLSNLMVSEVYEDRRCRLDVDRKVLPRIYVSI